MKSFTRYVKQKQQGAEQGVEYVINQKDKYMQNAAASLHCYGCKPAISHQHIWLQLCPLPPKRSILFYPWSPKGYSQASTSVNLLNKKKSVHAQLPATVPYFTQHTISNCYHGLLGLLQPPSLSQLSLFPQHLSPNNINVLVFIFSVSTHQHLSSVSTGICFVLCCIQSRQNGIQQMLNNIC